MFSVKSVGPKTLHCGTHDDKSSGSKTALQYLVDCCLPVRYKANHSAVLASALLALRLIRMLMFKVTKAREKSSAVMHVYFLASLSSNQLLG